MDYHVVTYIQYSSRLMVVGNWKGWTFPCRVSSIVLDLSKPGEGAKDA